MSNTYIEPILWSKSDYEDLFLKFFNKYTGAYGDPPSTSATTTIDFYDNTVEDDNFVSSYAFCSGFGRWAQLRQSAFSINFAKWGVKLTPNTGRVCLIRVPVLSNVDDTYIYQYVMVGNSDSAILCDYHGLTSVTYNNQRLNYDTVSGNQGASGNPSTTTTSISSNVSLTPVNNSTTINTFVNSATFEDYVKNNLINLFTDGLTKGYYKTISPLTSGVNAYGLHVGFPTTNLAVYNSLEKVPSWIPVFYIEDGATPIENYLDNGDDSGKKDPFDPSNKKTETITDKLSDYRVFAYRDESNKARTKFSVIAYNTENVAKWDRLADDWGLIVFDTIHDFDFALVGSKTNAKYPQLTFTHEMSTDYYALGVGFENLSEDFDITPIKVVFSRSETSESHVKSTGVNYDGTTTRSNIPDGYKYTASNGHWVEVLYRAPDIKDVNGGYPDPDDIENDEEGTDSSFSGASGMRTFAIDNLAFDTINQKLWSTDWTQVFKSSSIDPIKCVISCKGIPFTADNVANAEIVIANMNTGISKNYVKSVKSYKIPSVLMPHFNDDYTDITLTHVRCYLPYVGWVELPASEVISRVAYSSVGIDARPKRLSFKYLVDFIDGSVRCVVSVNNTERWFFDGHCGVDIPVTSDNHTQAISNAIRSGVQTGLSVVTSIVGVASENVGAVAGGVLGAMNNAPNIFPTYSYTATSNGSGYINTSMNQHIMIVIERPNVIRDKDYNKRVGVPCGLSLNLGSLRGFTVCQEVDVNGIDATPDELAMIKSTLESGIYL